MGENGWELLLHRNQVGAQHHRFRVTVRAGGDARSDDHWRHMVGRNLFGEEDEPWYRLAVRETSLRGAQLDYEHAALLMVSQRDDPDLIPSERLTILRDGHLESVDVPARVTGTSCRLPLPSPIPGGRVVRNDIGSVFASTAPESPYAMTFGVERPCPDGRSATSAPCPERAVLHVGVCDSGRGWRTLELGAGRHPAIHRDPDGTLLVARSLDDAMEILSVVLPRDPSARSTPSEVVPAL